MPIKLPKKQPGNKLEEEPSKPEPSAPPSELLKIKQAAAFAAVAQITVRRWLKDGRLPAYRAGYQIRIDKADLIKFLGQY